MKKLSLLFCGFLALVLVSCSGSDTYRGTWNAIDTKGSTFKITFDAKNFIVKDSSGKTESFEYSQYSVKLENSKKTYGIKLGNGTQYTLYFEDIAKDSTGIIYLENGDPLFKISKKSLSASGEVNAKQ